MQERKQQSGQPHEQGQGQVVESRLPPLLQYKQHVTEATRANVEACCFFQ